MPLVSVVIATKNRPVLVVRAIMSVFNQTIADLEVIVVMDGEGPETAARLNAIEDRRLRVYVNPVSLGSGAARNIGASQAQGAWIAFLDDDDEWLPTKLERQIALSTPYCGRIIVTCLSAYVTPHGTSIRPRSIFNNDIPFDEWLFDRRQLFGGDSFIQTSSLMMPTALFRQIGFPAHGQHEDWEFVIILLKRLDAILLTVPEVLVRHYAEEDRASLTAAGKLERSLLWLEEMRGVLTKRAFSGFCLTVVAHQARRVGGWRECRELLSQAFRYGQPTLFQLGIFLIVWTVPRCLHLALRRFRPGAILRPGRRIVSAKRQYVS